MDAAADEAREAAELTALEALAWSDDAAAAADEAADGLAAATELKLASCEESAALADERTPEADDCAEARRDEAADCAELTALAPADVALARAEDAAPPLVTPPMMEETWPAIEETMSPWALTAPAAKRAVAM